MKTDILLSVLIPSIPSRFALAQKLFQNLESQVSDSPVEILMLVDNKSLSIGAKREALMQSCKGSFVAYADDDDEIAPNYISEIVSAVQENPSVDVITFKQNTVLDGKKFTVDFDLNCKVPEQAQLMYDGNFRDIKRPPWTVCAWRTSLAKKYHFPDTGFDEDWQWVQQLMSEAKTQHKIDSVLHTYRYNSATSEGDQTIQARQQKESQNVQPA